MNVYRWSDKKQALVLCKILKGQPCRWYYGPKARRRLYCHGVINARGKCPQCGWVSVIYVDGELRPPFVAGTIDEIPEDDFWQLQKDAKFLSALLRTRDALRPKEGMGI